MNHISIRNLNESSTDTGSSDAGLVLRVFVKRLRLVQPGQPKNPQLNLASWACTNRIALQAIPKSSDQGHLQFARIWVVRGLVVLVPRLCRTRLNQTLLGGKRTHPLYVQCRLSQRSRSEAPCAGQEVQSLLFLQAGMGHGPRIYEDPKPKPAAKTHVKYKAAPLGCELHELCTNRASCHIPSCCTVHTCNGRASGGCLPVGQIDAARCGSCCMLCDVCDVPRPTAVGRECYLKQVSSAKGCLAVESMKN